MSAWTQHLQRVKGTFLQVLLVTRLQDRNGSLATVCLITSSHLQPRPGTCDKSSRYMYTYYIWMKGVWSGSVSHCQSLSAVVNHYKQLSGTVGF